MDPRKPKSPTLLAALQNPYLKDVSYTLPDGTIIIEPRRPVAPELSKVIKVTLINSNFAVPICFVGSFLTEIV